MANKRDLKKDINYVLGDIIEAVYIWELANSEKPTKERSRPHGNYNTRDRFSQVRLATSRR